MNMKHNWTEIQKFYDEGYSLSDISKKYGIDNHTLSKAKQRGDLKTRTPLEGLKLRLEKYGARKQSETTKKKLSEARTKYLTENPDKVPYIINHSSRKSWPEEVFENALKSEGIVGWEYKYRHGIYEYDFAFPYIKLDVEVDGGTHKTEKVKKIDAKRDDFSKSNGWKVIRFDAELIKKDAKGCVNEVRKFLPADMYHVQFRIKNQEDIRNLQSEYSFKLKPNGHLSIGNQIIAVGFYYLTDGKTTYTQKDFLNEVEDIRIKYNLAEADIWTQNFGFLTYRNKEQFEESWSMCKQSFDLTNEIRVKSGYSPILFKNE